jgi:2-polyprenyl-6-methoxyphenol hydroxylase-like FAD-dependent oxidoreductase
VRTQVAIVGAGPAGLMLAHLLSLEGIESRTRAYVEQRVRAGVLEQGTADLLDATGVGARMRSEGLVHHGIRLRFGGGDHRIDFGALTGGRGIIAAGAWSLAEGPIIEKGISAMRSFVVEPMQFGRLFLSGDAAHIVPPTGAKGMNLAIRDVSILSDALTAFFRSGDGTLLGAYSTSCLRRVWRAQQFPWWMTSMLHRFPDSDAAQARLQLAQLAYTVDSRAASTSLAENYVGYEWTTT